MSYKKIGIILEKNRSGTYKYKKVEIFDGNQNNNLYADSNTIELTSTNISALKEGKNTRVVSRVDEEKQFITLLLPERIFNIYYNACQQDGLDNNESLRRIEETMIELGQNILEGQGELMDGILSVEIKASPLEADKNDTKEQIDLNAIKPSEIIRNIKEKVKGQDHVVDSIVYTLYNNQKLIDSGDKDVIETGKASILLDGPTGTGKTATMKLVSKEMGIPVVIRSATKYSTAGYTGANLTEILTTLLDKAKGNIKLAERGIVVIDEFDKLGQDKSDNADPLTMKKSVQDDLLDYLSGSTIPIEYNGKKIEFDTSKLSFVALGAFTDMRERKIREELDENRQYTISQEDYIDAGIKRELVGRFSVLLSTKSLGKEDLKEILKTSKTSPIEILKQTAREYGKSIVCSEEMIDFIAEVAAKKGIGARALKEIIEGIRTLIMSEIIDGKNYEIEITRELYDKYAEGSKRNATEEEIERASQEKGMVLAA